MFLKIKKNQTEWDLIINNRLLLFILIVFSHLFIASCVKDQWMEKTIVWTDRLQTVEKLSDFRIHGSLSLVFKEDSFIGNFDYTNSNASSEFFVRDYFGNLIFQDNLKNTTLRDIYSVLGESATDNSLFVHNKISFLNLLLAKPSGINQKQLIFDDKGWLVEIKYPDWTIRYDSFQEISGIVLPRKILILGQSFRITLVSNRLEIIS
jgi:outer membrane biogenesis lipoprotein LolB